MTATIDNGGKMTGYRVKCCGRMVGWKYTGNYHACANLAAYFAQTTDGTFFFCEDCAPWAQKFGLILHRII